MPTPPENSKRQRRTHAEDATYHRETGWVANPYTVAANIQREVCTVQLEIASGGTVRVCDGGETASATNGYLLDATNGPTIFETENQGAISVYKATGAPAVTIGDSLVVGGVAR